MRFLFTYAEHHRAVAPEAHISPRLESLITHQLEQRVVQEAELLLARAKSGVVEAAQAVEPVAVLSTGRTAQPCRTWARGITGVPEYAMQPLVQDVELQSQILDLLERTARTRQGWLSGAGSTEWHLQPHRHTVDMAIALWRLATWRDSGARA